jgi:hypothetical protein
LEFCLCGSGILFEKALEDYLCTVYFGHDL